MIRSLFSAVSGLLAHQESMDVIGNNIANINTVGFKASNAEFGEAFSQSERLASESQPVGLDVGLGVRVIGTTTDFTQGAEEATNVPSNIMISGNGFFAVNTSVHKPGSTQTSTPTTGSGDTVYTRAGDFTVDKDGYMRTGDGYYVMGYSAGSSSNALADGTTDTSGFVSGTVYSDFDASNPSSQVSDSTLTAIQIPSTITTQITPTAADVTAATALTTGATANDTAVAAASADSTSTTATAADLLTDLQVIYNGGVSPATGTAVTTAAAAQTSATANANATSADASTQALTTANSMLGAAKAAYTAVAAYAANPSDASLKATALSAVQALQTASTATVSDSTAASTQATSDRASGATTTTAVVNYSIGTDGAINVVGQDGTNVTIGYVPLATFANQGGLANQGGGYFTPTKASGPTVIDTPGHGTAGSTVGGALELSNADVATEFSNMIIIQRGYDANSKVITASNEMLQTADNLIQ